MSGGYDILGFNGEVELPIHAISSMCNKSLCVNILTSNRDCLLHVLHATVIPFELVAVHAGNIAAAVQILTSPH